MIFRELGISGAYLIEPEMRKDDRGFFARAFCSETLKSQGLCDTIAQCNISYNNLAGTLRGMHYQLDPHAEVKIVRCTAGAIFDAIVDLRPDSPTYLQWVGVELSADNRCLVYVPQGCAHGYQALSDGTEVFYQASAPYAPGAERGLRFDDPAFGIRWPLPVSVISEKDRSLKFL